MRVADKVQTLLRYLEEGASDGAGSGSFVDLVLLDVTRTGLGRDEVAEMESRGVGVVDVPLITDESHPHLDDRLLLEALLSLC